MVQRSLIEWGRTKKIEAASSQYGHSAGGYEERQVPLFSQFVSRRQDFGLALF